MELRRIGKKIEKRQSQRSSEQEQEYLRDLIRNKKKDGDPMIPGAAQSSPPLAVSGGLSTAYSNLVKLTHAWMFPVDESHSLGSVSTYTAADTVSECPPSLPPHSFFVPTPSHYVTDSEEKEESGTRRSSSSSSSE